MYKTPHIGKAVDIIGKRFGRLVVVKFAGKRSTCWLVRCKCDCGNYTTTRPYDLLYGKTKSCGCYRKDFPSKTKKTHGMSFSRIHRIWTNMKQRCYNSNATAYKRYGGRGIAICDRWKNSFENFYKDMSKGYADNLQIERIDNNGNYYPENCRWAAHTEQSFNKRSNMIIKLNGISQPLAKWLEHYRITKSAYYGRIRLGWSIEKALITPIRHQFSKEQI